MYMQPVSFISNPLRRAEPSTCSEQYLNTEGPSFDPQLGQYSFTKIDDSHC